MLTRHRDAVGEEDLRLKEMILLEAENQAHSKFGTPRMVCGSRVKEGIRMVTVRDELDV